MATSGKELTQFKPGQHANPLGRTPLPTHVRDLARGYTAKCMEVLMQCVLDENERWAVRQTAVQQVLDRAWGKAASVMPEVGEDGKSTTITMLSTESLKQLLYNSTQHNQQPEPTQPEPTHAVIADT